MCTCCDHTLQSPLTRRSHFIQELWTCLRVGLFRSNNYLVHLRVISWASRMRMAFSWFYCTRTLRFRCNNKKNAIYPSRWCLYTSTHNYNISYRLLYTHSLGSPLKTGEKRLNPNTNTYIHVLSQTTVILNPADGFAYHFFSGYVTLI